MTQYYDNLADRYLSEFTHLKKQYNRYSFFRLALAIALIFTIYRTLVSGEWLYAPAGAVLAVLFVLCIRKHRAILWEKKMAVSLNKVNREESAFVALREKPFYNGGRYADSSHFYTFDLDIFGENSLFQYLNRTTTYIGEAKLAESLGHPFSAEEVLRRQEAIKELAENTGWRQYLTALGKITQDSETDYRKLLKWSEDRSNEVDKRAEILAFQLPVLFVLIGGGCLAGWFAWKWLLPAFLGNLIFTGTQLAKIKRELIDSQNVAEIIHHYGLIIREIESGTFRSRWLRDRQEALSRGARGAGGALQQLSGLFLKIDGIKFVLGALLVNGTLVYHVHVLRSLLKWKRTYAAELHRWLEVMGEIEALSNYANFAFNHPDYTWPVLNSRPELYFEAMGHPLIAWKSRVNNDVRLGTNNFMILTGSNMSGKSTFLRALGVNMVLAGAGAPVCAEKAEVYLLPVLVSMRQSDSLSSGESYFFAEVKRLKAIMDELEFQPCLVLLDEILRGTNSDDKQTGTIGVIRKIIAHTSLGGIATHDLAICQLTDEYPDRLENKNFEVEIINGELAFDYKLRNGVCKNKSATFLMEKMKII